MQTIHKKIYCELHPRTVFVKNLLLGLIRDINVYYNQLIVKILAFASYLTKNTIVRNRFNLEICKHKNLRDMYFFILT